VGTRSPGDGATALSFSPSISIEKKSCLGPRLACCLARDLMAVNDWATVSAIPPRTCSRKLCKHYAKERWGKEVVRGLDSYGVGDHCGQYCKVSDQLRVAE
jgi:hypothetical protein